jgi:23S rRNA (adenine2503-C2)-methyltransferase
MYKVFESSEGNVFKYVFTEHDYVAETVLYKYEDFMKRTVICCSTQSGCPVGCKFCGTGNKFIRDLTSEEIVNQIITVLKDKGLYNDIKTDIAKTERFQIMFMSMGEPMLNWENVEQAIYRLHRMFPNAELLLSTIGIKNNIAYKGILTLSANEKFGLQFSIHKSTDEIRSKLIPYDNKLSLKELRDFGIMWEKLSNRKVYLNYCIDGTNNTKEDFEKLSSLFSPLIFAFTFSVVCSANENMKDAGYKQLDKIAQFQELFIKDGYNTRIFNPNGQDDIGGGCGQLWYVQEWMKNYKN